MSREITIRWSIKTLVVLLILVILIFGGSWFLYQGLKNNHQANRQPQAADILTAPIVQQTLQETHSGMGHVTTENISVIEVLQGAPSVVTRQPQPIGAQLVSGDVLTTIDERPLFIFTGSLPAYRDLAVGARGEDVVQVQQTLVNLGYPIWDELGYYGRDTAYAVYRFYLNSGYYPPDDVDQSHDPEAPYSTRLPRTEYVALNFDSFHVENSCGTLGQAPPSPLCSVSDGSYTLYFEPEVNAPGNSFEPGQPVVLESAEHASIEGALGEPVDGERAQRILGDVDSEAPPKTLYSITLSQSTELVPGQSYSATVVVEASNPEALTVPESALVYDDETTSVILAEGSQSVQVTVGYCYRGYCELIDPAPSLRAGEDLELASTERNLP